MTFHGCTINEKGLAQFARPSKFCESVELRFCRFQHLQEGAKLFIAIGAELEMLFYLGHQLNGLRITLTVGLGEYVDLIETIVAVNFVLGSARNLVH